ncbi:hypothetical protein HPP92_006548 [Vanilla planifolia]|uniref:Uncharacterized protein n=1 Tax=Vanilla planifolia TaxID=51239 RepID=A0A835VDP8_VANPL|nr:hypothetical protein HPP92_006548 [Vanilla planifolia]
MEGKEGGMQCELVGAGKWEVLSGQNMLIHQKDFYGNSGISIQVFYQMKQ